MKIVAVTGASSFIGYNLTLQLLEQGCKVYAIVRSPEKIRITHPQLHIICCDMSDYADLSKKINEKIDAFYHLAWNGTRGNDRNNDELQSTNIKYSLDAVNAAYSLGAKVFIGSGSQAEYGRCEGIIKEDYPVNPNTDYGKAKLAVLTQGCKLAEEKGIRFIWCRIFSIYGIGDYEGTLVISSLKKMLNNEPVDLSLCTQSWDYLHIKDLVRAMVMISEAETGIYNIANGEYRPLKEFVEEIKRLSGSSSKLNFGAIPSNNVVSFMPDSEKLRNSIGWKPEIKFEDGIIELIEHMRNNK